MINMDKERLNAIRKDILIPRFKDERYNIYSIMEMQAVLNALDRAQLTWDELNLQIAGLKGANAALERVAMKIAEENTELKEEIRRMDCYVEQY